MDTVLTAHRDFSDDAEVAEIWHLACKTNKLLTALDRMLRDRVMHESDGGTIDINIVAGHPCVYHTLFYWLRLLAPLNTVETGFGLGVTALMFCAHHYGSDGGHIAIDPYFLDGNLSDRARRVIAALDPGKLEIVREASELALPRFILTHRIRDLAFSFIDGSHLFDHAMIDFFYLDRATRIGGIIAIDDLRSPAVEALVSFIRENRCYAVNTTLRDVALCQKLGADERPWYHFRPFTIPAREDWALADYAPHERVPPHAAGAVMPPSTMMTDPVMAPEPRSQIMATIDATSSAPSSRPMG